MNFVCGGDCYLQRGDYLEEGKRRLGYGKWLKEGPWKRKVTEGKSYKGKYT